MSRIKILLLLLIIAALSIVFVQNRQPIALKMLCADSSQTCLYQTPSLPLSVWIALATLTGAIANLLVQTLNRYGYSDSKGKRTVLNEDLYPDKGWKEDSDSRRQYSATKVVKDSTKDKIADPKVYETKQEPQNVERSGSTYSYKYREAGDRSKDDSSIKNNSENSKTDFDATTESNEEDWI